MKTTAHRLFIALLLAGGILASCSKEDGFVVGPEQAGSVQADGLRVISLSYTEPTKATPGDAGSLSVMPGTLSVMPGSDPASHPSEPTKAALTGLLPSFVAGDVIKVSNGETFEDCTVAVMGGEPYITTSLGGNLTAVFPATAAILDGQDITGVGVPGEQDGTPESTVIASATIPDGAVSAAFRVAVSVLKINLPAGTRRLTVKSLRPIDNGVARSIDAAEINTDGTTAADRLVVTVGDGSTDLPETVHVAILSGARFCDLSFDAAFATAGTGSMKGIPEYNTPSAANRSVSGVLYTISDSNWHEYVTIGGLKWATMNVGASSVTDSGEYFMWGEVVGHRYVDGSWTNFPSANPDSIRYTGGWNASNAFNTSNTPYFQSGTTYRKYTAGGSVLDLCDDAANFNWGGSWRMPVKSEITALAATAKRKVTSPVIGWYYDSDRIFFLTAGYGNGSGAPVSATSCASVWSSTLDSDTKNGSRLNVDQSTSEAGNVWTDPRNIGHGIRPVSD